MKSQRIISLNPGKNYEKVGEVNISTRSEIDTKISKAHKAKYYWASLGVKGRRMLLEPLYQEFINKQKEIQSLASQEMGMPISVSKLIDIEAGLRYMRGYLDLAPEWLAPETVFEDNHETHQLLFEPLGVAGISIPWNYPFCNFIWGVIQNLIIGNTVVFKHSEECPLTAKLLEEIVNSVELPEGVFNAIYGDGSDVGNYLMSSNLNCMYFTGSTRVGKHLYQVAAKSFIPALLELGGSAAGIVLEDVNIQETVKLIYEHRFINSGQTCDGLKRLIVHRSRFDELVDTLTHFLSTKKIGNPQDTDTDMGPLVAERQLVLLEEQVYDALKKGAKIITGGKRTSGIIGAYYNPTILTDITFDMRIWKEEVFGPVLPIVPYDTQEEAIALANDTEYGLGGYIYTTSLERALLISKLLQTGNISINGANYNMPQDSFGGYKNSGLGFEHGKEGLRDLCLKKIIAFKK
ncbi:unnamed protein product [Didymodactylos carnosus]|uniref:Aldehyde dehydrogenase domain-containing protein n=1 Tax=Didymodactylos carnosus TaxID=1234261 RepID=A0A814Y2P1_9BILA|nr:unnamed protein product [Didymodactylos carnosus]CAF3986903.1 unnamed protein product [Didymodactylos carnosus]